MVVIPTLTPKLLEQMTEAIVQAVAPEQIVLFGSQARGTAGPHSDVDLLVVTAEGFGPHRSRIKEITRISKSVGKFGIPTDILLYSQQEVEDWKDSRNHVAARALREGKVIYERCAGKQSITPEVMSLDERLQNQRDRILTIAERYGAYNVRVFGSVARGESQPTSDVDFLVEMQPGHSLLDRIALKQDLEDLLGCQVDVATLRTLHEGIKDRVLQDAKPL
jgi:predicted nucleotidyltransferase